MVCCRLCRCENGSAEDSFSGRASIHPRADHVGQWRGRPTTPCTPGSGLPSLPRQGTGSRSRHRRRSSVPPEPRSSAPPNLDIESPAIPAVWQRGPAQPSRHAERTARCELRTEGHGCDDDDRAGSDLAHFNAAGSTPRCWSPTYETCWAPSWSPTAAVSRKPARADGTGTWLANMTYSGCDWRTRPRGPSTQGASQR